MRLAWLSTCLCVSGLAGGCGQKGPLLLPDTHPRTPVIVKPASPQAAATPAPATGKQNSAPPNGAPPP